MSVPGPGVRGTVCGALPVGTRVVLSARRVAIAPTLESPGEVPGPQTGLAHAPPAGLAYICEGLKEQRKGLATLVLWNNQLTHTGMAFLGMTLVSRPARGKGAPESSPHLPHPSSQLSPSTRPVSAWLILQV